MILAKGTNSVKDSVEDPTGDNPRNGHWEELTLSLYRKAGKSRPGQFTLNGIGL